MKWFKHLSMAGEDDFMVHLLDVFGMAGVGMWWSLVERVARGVKDPGDVPVVKTSVNSLARKWRVKPRTLMQFVRICEEWRKLSVFLPDGKANMIEISFPKILKYTDEWSRKVRSKSGASPEPVRSESGASPPIEQNRTEEKSFKQLVGNTKAAGIGIALRESLAAAGVKKEEKPRAPDTWQPEPGIKDIFDAFNRENKDIILSMAPGERNAAIIAQQKLLEARKSAKPAPRPLTDQEKFLPREN